MSIEHFWQTMLSKAALWWPALVLAAADAFVLAVPAAAQDGCAWFGSRPFCDGQCPSGYVYTGRREACATGSRRYCCPTRYTRVPAGRTNCQWVGDPGSMLYVCDDPQAGPYAAVAIDGKGHWGASIQPPSLSGPRDTAARAGTDALRRCGPGCNIAINGQGQCVGVAESHAGGYWVGYAHGTTRSFVTDGALNGCAARAPAGSCRIVHANCL